MNSGRVPLGTSIWAITWAGGIASGKYSTPLLNSMNRPTLPTNATMAMATMMPRCASDHRIPTS